MFVAGKLNEMTKEKKVYVWIIDRDWKGMFYAKKVLKSEVDTVNLKQHKTKAAAKKAMSDIWIDDGYQ